MYNVKMIEPPIRCWTRDIEALFAVDGVSYLRFCGNEKLCRNKKFFQKRGLTEMGEQILQIRVGTGERNGFLSGIKRAFVCHI